MSKQATLTTPIPSVEATAAQYASQLVVAAREADRMLRARHARSRRRR